MISDDLARIRLDENEAALRTEIQQQPIAADVAQRFRRFADWCSTSKGVRYLPAQPWVVAAFLEDQAVLGIGDENLMALVESIRLAHWHYRLADPTNTPDVSNVLGRVIKADLPRSWPQSDLLEWLGLPVALQRRVRDRELARDKDLRNKQNLMASLRRKHKQTEENLRQQTEENMKGISNDQSTQPVSIEQASAEN